MAAASTWEVVQSQESRGWSIDLGFSLVIKDYSALYVFLLASEKELVGPSVWMGLRTTAKWNGVTMSKSTFISGRAKVVEFLRDFGPKATAASLSVRISFEYFGSDFLMRLVDFLETLPIGGGDHFVFDIKKLTTTYTATEHLSYTSYSKDDSIQFIRSFVKNDCDINYDELPSLA